MAGIPDAGYNAAVKATIAWMRADELQQPIRKRLVE